MSLKPKPRADAARSSNSPTRLPLSPRRRRLRITVAVLSSIAGASVALGFAFFFLFRAKPYEPGELSLDVTSQLVRSLPTNAPNPRFSDMTHEAGLSGFRTFIGNRTSQLPEDNGPGAAWADFNNDGNDDLFLVSAGGTLNAPTDQLAPCELYENLGNSRFRKVESFPETRIHGMAAAWGDYDGDGFLDLIVTGYNALLLFHNERGTGSFVRDERFPNRNGFWAGASWGDYNNDRVLDFYVCGYVQYEDKESNRARGSQQLGAFVPYTLNPASYLPATNLLFHNNGDGTFAEVGAKLGVQNPEGRSLGALWHDFDDDGWVDLYVANDISDNVLYHNLGGRFEDISHAAYVADYRSAMGLAAGDFDRDGDDDLYITHWVAQENALYENLWADLKKMPQNRASADANTTSACIPRFMDIADRTGLGQIALPFVGWGAEFADFDGDGWIDLIVANGSTLEFEGPHPKTLKPQEPFLFWNRRGEHFYNIAPFNKSLSEQHVSRGLAVSDYDNDGAIDLLLVHLGEGAQLLRNEMQTGHWLKVRLRSRLKNGAPLGFGDGATLIVHVNGVALRRTISSASYLSQSSRTLHFGLADANVVESLEVRWLGGQTNLFNNLAANATWEIIEGEPTPKRIEHRAPNGRVSARVNPDFNRPSSQRAPRIAPSQTDRNKLVEFWNIERAALNALKVEKNIPKATQFFRQALELDPKHEDARYYFGQCLSAQGNVSEALAQWDELIRINPQSHRAYQQWGALRARSATSADEIEAAEKYLNAAHALNPEETGALLILGETALLRHDSQKAEERLSAACRANPRAVGGFFLRGYLAALRGDQSSAHQRLVEARQALGKDWQPKGSTSEGDVKQQQHWESTPLSRFWENWDGTADPTSAFIGLDKFLKHPPAAKPILNPNLETQNK